MTKEFRMQHVVNEIDFSCQRSSLSQIIDAYKADNYGVMVLKNIDLDHEMMETLAYQLGNPVIRKSDGRGNSYKKIVFHLNSHDSNGNLSKFWRFGNTWHADYTTTRVMGGYTALYCLKAPDKGGGTSFLSLNVRDATKNVKKFIESKLGHRLEKVYVHHENTNLGKKAGVSVHPFLQTVRTPVGYYFVPGSYSYSKINDPSVDKNFIRNFYDQLAEAGSNQTIASQARQLIVWDNRLVAHKSEPYDPNVYQRSMIRVATWGCSPVAPDIFKWPNE